VTIAEACARFRVKKTAVGRARKRPEANPTLAELALAALTGNGTRFEGVVADLEGVASWLQYINKDDSTALSVRALLAPMVDRGLLAFDRDRWQLLRPWP